MLKLKKPHEVGKLVTPTRYAVLDVSHVYRSDWTLYGKGMRSPAGSTLAQVNGFAAGTAEVYTHAIWSVLDLKRRSEHAWASLKSSLRFANTRPKRGGDLAQIRWALGGSPLDSVAELLIARQVSLLRGGVEEARQAEHLIFRLCVAHAAVDKAELPFEGLIQLLNEWFALRSKVVWPFYSISAFRECVRAVRQCKPKRGATFLIATNAMRISTTIDALRGRFGVDIPLACQPIYLCSCAKSCAHFAEARHSRRVIGSAMQMLRGKQHINPCDEAL